MTEALKGNTTLTRLHLSRMHLRDEKRVALGLSSIGEALAQNTTLTALHLCGTGMNDVEVKLWHGNTTLKELGLRMNTFSSEGVCIYPFQPAGTH